LNNVIHNIQIVDEHRASRGNASGRVFALPISFPPMSFPSSVVPAIPDDAGPERIDPTSAGASESLAPNSPVQQDGSVGSTDDGATASVLSAANDIISLSQELILKAPRDPPGIARSLNSIRSRLSALVLSATAQHIGEPNHKRASDNDRMELESNPANALSPMRAQPPPMFERVQHRNRLPSRQSPRVRSPCRPRNPRSPRSFPRPRRPHTRRSPCVSTLSRVASPIRLIPPIHIPLSIISIPLLYLSLSRCIPTLRGPLRLPHIIPRFRLSLTPTTCRLDNVFVDINKRFYYFEMRP
jgi:hypothetical protein